MVRTHSELDNKHTQKNQNPENAITPHPSSLKEKKSGFLGACYITSLAE
jgi:hypothetical protein